MELYDAQLRASSLGLANIACRIGGASAPWIAKGNDDDMIMIFKDAQHLLYDLPYFGK